MTLDSVWMLVSGCAKSDSSQSVGVDVYQGWVEVR